MVRILFVVTFLFSMESCTATPQQTPPLQMGADQLDILIPLIKASRCALVVNHTSVINKKHLADTLQSLGVTIKKILAPEHGFRGSRPDGETIKDGMDTKTGIPIISIYGSNKKPSADQLQDVDVIIFDIQDVGTRFYTYISTMHYIMETCAEQNKKLIILDRPNPNGGYIDGPILEKEFQSFVGMHPIPIVHGLTVGELAKMINGEKWLENGVQCDVTIVPMKNWKHADVYNLPIKPSPNLPTDQSIKLYPSLCLFEGTVISVGRGTLTPFEKIGNPKLKDMPYAFTPIAIDTMSTNPPFKDKTCYGMDLSTVTVPEKIDLQYLLKMYQAYPEKEKFFIPYFSKLAGTKSLQEQIQKGFTEEQIRASWKPGLDVYKKMREKYLLYQ